MPKRLRSQKNSRKLHPGQPIDNQRIKWLREFKECNDQKSFDKLVLSFKKIIVKSAYKVSRAFGIPAMYLDDLIQVGFEAVTKGIKISNTEKYLVGYCALLIKSAQWKFVKKTNLIDTKLDSISRKSHKKLFFKISTLFDLLDTRDAQERERKRKKFSNKICVPVEDIIEAEFRLSISYTQINNEITSNRVEKNIEYSIDHKLMAREIHKAVNQLEEKHRIILEERFFTDEPKTLNQLGKELGCDRLTVNARRKAGIKQLREILRDNQVIREIISDV